MPCHHLPPPLPPLLPPSSSPFSLSFLIFLPPPEQNTRLHAEVEALRDERDALRLTLAPRGDAASSGGGTSPSIAAAATVATVDGDEAPGGAQAALLQDMSGKVVSLMEQMGIVIVIVLRIFIL